MSSACFPWASSFDSDFNYDFQAAVTKEQWESGAVEYNFRPVDFRLPEAANRVPLSPRSRRALERTGRRTGEKGPA
jgi:predicted dithiol-disulfide oxidoreductase (DUF899 family)